MTALYELTDDYRRLLDAAIDPETGEVDDSLEGALAALGGAIEGKLEGIAMVLRSMEADVASLKAEEQRLSGRRKSVEGSRLRLRKYMSENMSAADLNKVKTARFTISLAKIKQKPFIIDDKLISDDLRKPLPELCDQPVVMAELGKALASGPVPGAEMRDADRTLTIR